MSKELVTIKQIQNKIYNMPDRSPFMLAQDLAEIYESSAKKINRAVKRNSERFPSDFCFQLSYEESENLRCQIGTKVEPKAIENLSQSATKIYAGKEKLPYAFTREGANMLSAVLHTSIAIDRSIQIMRAYSTFEDQYSKERLKAARQAEKRASIEWQSQRDQVKKTTISTMESVKDFVEIAIVKGQEPFKAKMTYATVNKLVYKLLFGITISPKNPLPANFRDTLSRRNLKYLDWALDVVENVYSDSLMCCIDYHTPYQAVKNKLSDLVKLIGAPFSLNDHDYIELQSGFANQHFIERAA